MRILVDARPITDRTQGGVGRVSRFLVETHAAAYPDDELVLVTTGSERPAPPDPLGSTPNVRHLHLRVPNKCWSTLSWIDAVSFTREAERRAGRCDAAFFPNIGFLGRLTTPSVLLLHDLSFLIEPRWFTKRQRWWHRAVHAKRLIRDASCLLAVSETTKRDAVRILGIPEERIAVIPVGPTLSVIPAEAGIPPERYALALGWSDRRKNAKTAQAAVDILRRDPAFADVRLIVIGRDVIRPTDAELASLYANAAVFLYPSWYEGYGLPLHEAASFGTPCIASTSGALPETAPRGTIFANPAKPHHWAEALRVALHAPRIPIRTQTTWNEAASRLHAAFERIAP